MQGDENPARNIKPYSEGWEKLSIDERLKIWWQLHRDQMGNQAERYKTFLENFTAGYDSPCLEAYLNFKYDLYLYRYQHPELLLEGFYAIYNTSEEAILGTDGDTGAEPGYRLTTYMKVAEQYFASREEAMKEKAHLEAMEGFEPVNFYVVDKIQGDRKRY